MDTHQHWEQVYGGKAAERVSWFAPHLETSLRLIQRATRGDTSASIMDVGGGASTLVDDLLLAGYRQLTVLDLAETALAAARRRLGEAARSVRWLRADVTEDPVPAHAFEVWHDRAVFHFLTTREERMAYVRNAALAVKPGGHVIVGAFGPEGPATCSGLEVVRYTSDSLQAEFGPLFRLADASLEMHQTPLGARQQFLYCDCVRVE